MEINYETLRLINAGRCTFAEVDGRVIGDRIKKISFVHEAGEDGRLELETIPSSLENLEKSFKGEETFDFDKHWVDLKARAEGWDPSGEKGGKKPLPRKTKGLQFRDAWFHLLNGKKIRRPHWSGYWEWKRNTIIIHTREGDVFNILETDNPAYTFTNIAARDWEVVPE